jgi:hypothetical protein
LGVAAFLYLPGRFVVVGLDIGDCGHRRYDTYFEAQNAGVVNVFSGKFSSALRLGVSMLPSCRGG